MFFIPVLAQSAEIIKLFNNHHRSRAILDEARKANKVNKLQVAVATRWYSQFGSGMSVINAKYLLIEICEQRGDELMEIAPRTAEDVIDTIKSDEFWTELAAAMKLIEFPVNIIGKQKTYICCAFG